MKILIKSSFAIAVFAIAFTMFAASDANAQGVLNKILQRMDSYNKKLTTLQANIKMAKTNTQLNITTSQSGELFYIPGKGKDVYIRINWTDPDEVLVVAKGKFLLYRPRLNQAIKGKVEGSKNAKAGSALGFMHMSKSELRQNYDVSYIGQVKLDGSDVWHLRLVPKAKQSYKQAELWVNGDGFPVQARVFELNGDLTTVRLSSVKDQVKIDTRLFSYKLPKGTKIIDG